MIEGKALTNAAKLMERRKRTAAALGVPTYATVLNFNEWLKLARETMRLFNSCFISDGHGGHSLKSGCISDLQECRERFEGLLLLTVSTKKKTPRVLKERLKAKLENKNNE